MSEQLRHLSLEMSVTINYKLVLTNFARKIKLFSSSLLLACFAAVTTTNLKLTYLFEKAASTSEAIVVGESLIWTITHPLTSSRPSRHSPSSPSSWILSFWNILSILWERWTRGDFSTECRKTRTTVITLTNHKGHRQSIQSSIFRTKRTQECVYM